MVDNEPIVLPEQAQVVREHTPQPQLLVPATWPQTPEPCTQPYTPETHPLSGLEFLVLLIPQKPYPAVPTLREAEVSRNTLGVGMNQQLLSRSAGADSVSNIPLPDVPLPVVPFPNRPLPQAHWDGLAGEG